MLANQSTGIRSRGTRTSTTGGVSIRSKTSWATRSPRDTLYSEGPRLNITTPTSPGGEGAVKHKDIFPGPI